MSCSFKMVFEKTFFTVVIVLLLAGCTPSKFPSSPSKGGLRDVPFISTYWFNYTTDMEDIGTLSEDIKANLQIISGSDLLNLLAAANVEQQNGFGIVTGSIVGSDGHSLENVVVELRNLRGESVGDLFYNSLGGIPDFSRSEGTTSTGVFTIFNAPPGDLFITAVKGGRGFGRLFSFPDEIVYTLTTMVQVQRAMIGVTGQVLEIDGFTPVENVSVRALGFIPEQKTESNNPPQEIAGEVVSDICLQSRTDIESSGILACSQGELGFYRFDITSDSEFVVELKKEGYITTYHDMSTSLGLVQPGAPDVTLEMIIGSREGINELAGSVDIVQDEALGVAFGSITEVDGSPRPSSVAILTDAQGNEVGDLFYMSGSTLNKDLNSTGGKGSFIAFNLPPGSIFIKAHSSAVTSSASKRYGGSADFIVRPGGLSVEGITVHTINPIAQGALVPFTAAMYGLVTEDDGLTPVPDAEISILGIKGVKAVTRSDGSFFVDILDNPPEEGNKYGGVGLLANSLLFASVVAEGYLPTITLFATEPYSFQPDNGGFRVVKKEDVEKWAQDGGVELEKVVGLNGEEEFKGIIKGVIADNKFGISAEGITFTASDQFGNKVGDIRYFDIDETASLKESSSNNGEFVIFNLDSGIVYLNVESCDDSGSQNFRVFQGGITSEPFFVNDAPSPVIPFKGQVFDLEGKSVGSADITAVGSSIPEIQIDEKNTCFSAIETLPEDTKYSMLNFSSEPDGTFSAFVPSNQNNVFQISKENHLDTIFYDLRTFNREMRGVEFKIADDLQLDKLALQAGIIRNPELATVLGSVVVDGMLPGQIIESESPVAIKLGFYDPDPDLDLIVLNQRQNTFTTFFGRGDGTFKKGESYNTGLSPSDIAIGYMDGDNNLDVVVVNKDSNDMYIYKGGDQGNFDLLTIVGVGLAPSAVILADFNADLALDIVVASSGNGFMAAFIGSGLGGIAGLGMSRPIGTSLVDLAIYDINVDDFMDIAAVDRASPLDPQSGFYPEGIGVQFGGNADVVYLPTGENPTAIATGNFNHRWLGRDGKLRSDVVGDIAVANAGSNNILLNIISFPANVLTVAFAQVDLTFSPQSLFTVDINNDGKDDLISGGIDAAGGGQMAVIVGIGDGTFYQPEYYDTGLMPASIQAGEISGDDKIDVLIGNLNSDSVSVFINGNVSLRGAGVKATDLNSRDVGDIFYFDNEGLFLEPARDATSSSGDFIVFNVPPGLTNVSLTAGGTGNFIVSTFSGKVSSSLIEAISVPPAVLGVQGRTGDAVGRPQGDVRIQYLGAGIETKSFVPKTDEESFMVGLYQTLLPSNSKFIIKMTKSSDDFANPNGEREGEDPSASGIGSGGIVTRIGP